MAVSGTEPGGLSLLENEPCDFLRGYASIFDVSLGNGASTLPLLSRPRPNVLVTLRMLTYYLLYWP